MASLALAPNLAILVRVLRPVFRLNLAGGDLVLGERALVMGILNVTPDSFSDGGQYVDVQAGVSRALEMQEKGADLIDIGAESTRPGAERLAPEAELARLMPVLERLHGWVGVPISVDTYKPEVARRALAAGAQIINFPVLSDFAEMAEVARASRAPIILMHSRGGPGEMHQLPPMPDVVGEVLAGLRELRDRAEAAGIPRRQLILDPGFGFGKNGDENYKLLAGIGRLHELDCPLLAGTSRKSFIGRTLDAPARTTHGAQVRNEPHPRSWGTAATVTAAVLGGVHIVRVHDVAEMSQVVRVADAIASAGRE